MKNILFLFIATSIVVLSGCVSNTWFSSEYSKKYVLAGKSIIKPCDMFTSEFGLWFGGLDSVLCISPLPSPKEGSFKYLSKGTKIEIVRLFRIGAFNAYYSDAEVVVTYSDGSVQKNVYMEWPSGKGLLVESD